MSIVGMRNNMQSWFKYVMYGIAVVFVIGIFYNFAGNDPELETDSLATPLATINGEKLDRRAFELHASEMLRYMEQMQNRKLNAFEEGMIRGQTFDQMVDRTLLSQAAANEGFKVSRRELNTRIDEIVEEQISQLREQVLATVRPPEPELAEGEEAEVKDEQAEKREMDKLFEEELAKYDLSVNRLRSDIKNNLDPDDVRAEMLIGRLQDKWKESVDAGDKAIEASYDEYQFSQITVGFDTRTEAQAEEQAKQLAEKLRSGEDFAALAREHSDDHYSDRGGDRGHFARRAYLDRALADAVGSLEVGGIADPVRTDQGFVIAKLDDTRSALPEDFTDPDKKQEYTETYLAQEQNRIQREMMEDIRASAEIEVHDPEIRGYLIVKEMYSVGALSPEDQQAMAEEAVEEFRTAAEESGARSDVAARSYVQIAYLYDQLRRPGATPVSEEDQAKYRAEMRSALDNALIYTESNDIRLMAAEVAIEDSEYESALEHLEFVANSAYDDWQLRSQLLSLYQRMEDSGLPQIDELIKQEREWFDDFEQRMQEQQAGMPSFEMVP